LIRDTVISNSYRDSENSGKSSFAICRKPPYIGRQQSSYSLRSTHTHLPWGRWLCVKLARQRRKRGFCVHSLEIRRYTTDLHDSFRLTPTALWTCPASAWGIRRQAKRRSTSASNASASRTAPAAEECRPRPFGEPAEARSRFAWRGPPPSECPPGRRGSEGSIWCSSRVRLVSLSASLSNPAS